MSELGTPIGSCAAHSRAGGVSQTSPIERAIAALRAGRPVAVGAIVILSAETGSQAMLDLLDPRGRAPLLLSGPRAMALGLGNAHDAAGNARPVEVRHCDWLDRDTARALADPGRDFDRGPIGPLAAVPL